VTAPGSSVVEWHERGEFSDERIAHGPGEQPSGTSEGGPHIGPLQPRQRRMYRFTFGLMLWVEAMAFITMFALKIVYAGTNGYPSAIDMVPPAVVFLLLAVGIVPVQLSLRAARADDRRTAALRQLLPIVLVLGIYAAIAVDWAEAFPSVSASSHYGEVWYTTNVLFGTFLLCELFGQLGAVTAGLRRRSGEFTFDVLSMQWLALFVFWIFIWGIVYTL
jgi:hypothetical protein